jgi:predicted RND superfamily exporter protein
VFYLFVVSSLVLFAFFASKLDYEEDISKLLPSTDNTKAEGLTFSELKVKDRIYVQVFSKTGASDADALLDASLLFVDSLTAYDADDGDVGDLFYEIGDDLRQEALAFLLDNVAVMTDSATLLRFETLTRSKENIFSIMANNRAILSSPEGSVYYRIMRFDPLNFRDALLGGSDSNGSGNSSDSNGDGNYNGNGNGNGSDNDISGSGGGGGSIEKLLGGNFALYGNHLFTKDTTAAVILVSPNFVSFDSGAGTRLVNKIERAREQIIKENPDIEILFHGPPVQSVFNSRQIKKDLTLTTGASLLLACLLIALCFSSFRTLPMLIFPIVYGTVFAMACMYLIQGKMSLMALGIGAVALGVAISYCLHVITHSRYVSDPVQLLKEQVKPVILGSLTTVGAFMGLLFTQSSLLRDFGLFASLAMVGATLASLVFLPQWMKPTALNHRSNKIGDIITRLNAYPLEKQRWLLVAIVIIFAVSIYKSSGVKFDANLRNIGYNEPEVVRSTELYAQKTAGGLATGYYAATSDNLDSAMYRNIALSRICDSLQRAGVIESFTHSSTLLLPEAVQNKRIAAWKSFWDNERVTQLRRDITDAAKANGFKPEMFDPFFDLLNRDYQPFAITDELSSLLSNIIEKQGDTYLIYTAVNMPKENTAEVNDLLAGQDDIIVADPFYYTTNMVNLLHDDFNTVLWISSLFVLLTLLIAFRSIKIALIAFLPMAMSWYIVLGVMAMLGLQFNLINIIISAFIFGIGVDYSIFVMQGLIADQKDLLAEHKTAIFLSAIILIISISSLMFATHPALSSIGVASLIGMTSAILIAYTVEPFLYKLLKKQ